jgi:hypothetical protein
MTEPDGPKSLDPETESFTAWHPMLLALLEHYQPGGWKILAELLLSRLPQRVDIVVLRQEEVVAGTPRKLHSVFDHLRPHTLIEHKGPTDDLEPGDVLTLLGYAGQYMRLFRISDPEKLCLMVLADRIPKTFVDQVKRMEGTLAEVGDGLWRGKMAGMMLHGVETREAWRASPSEHLLYTFSRAYLSHPDGLLPLDPEEFSVYALLYQQVEQFRKNRGTMAMKDVDVAQQSYQAVLAELIEKQPPEIRLRGLTPEERVAGLTPEQILALVPPSAVEEYARKLRH